MLRSFPRCNARRQLSKSAKMTSRKSTTKALQASCPVQSCPSPFRRRRWPKNTWRGSSTTYGRSRQDRRYCRSSPTAASAGLATDLLLSQNPDEYLPAHIGFALQVHRLFFFLASRTPIPAESSSSRKIIPASLNADSIRIRVDTFPLTSSPVSIRLIVAVPNLAAFDSCSWPQPKSARAARICVARSILLKFPDSRALDNVHY
jgi:hypothetical protein